MALRLAYMGTPDFAVPPLRALIDAGHDIACVYSQPPRRAVPGTTKPNLDGCVLTSVARIRTPGRPVGAPGWHAGWWSATYIDDFSIVSFALASAQDAASVEALDWPVVSIHTKGGHTLKLSDAGA